MGTHTSKRRIVISAIVGVLIIGGSYAIVLGEGASPATASGTDELLKELASKDTDADGVLDWEEVLYSTDPRNAHSFRADITDGEAVAQGLVTLKAPEAPGMATSTDNFSDHVPGAAATDESLTSQFARSIFNEYAQKSGGKPLSASDKQNLVDELIDSFKNNTSHFFTSHYSLSSLNVGTDAQIDAYTNEVEIIFSKGSGIEGDTDPISLIEKVASDDLAARDNLASLAAYYADVAAELAKTRVPEELLNAHLALVQSFDISALAAATIAHIDDDPLIALAALPVFDSAPKAAFASIQEIVESVTREYGTPDAPTKAGFALRQLVLASQETP